MVELKVTLETVTPLFLGGADPRGVPELRAASVRGALRFWLRALLGGILGDQNQNLKSLRTAEAAVFGSTDTGASPVVVRIAGSPQPPQPYRPLLHSSSKTFTFQGIKPGEKITLTLSSRPPHDSVPDAAWGAFLTFVLLGGLGKRSRRGFGSLIVRSASNEAPMQPPDYSDLVNFSKQLPSLIHEVRRAIQSFLQTMGLKGSDPNSPPHFPILHGQHSKILFCKRPFQSWEEAMKEFWNVLRSDPYRDKRVFGFAGSDGRQASPLHLRILKLGNSYYILITAFRVRFAGGSPSWEVMQRFLNYCKEQWKGDWVFGGGVEW